ncbi:MAG TPA: hypothetical protein VGO55_03250 [Allosphingosinicella sp.]|jgi:hypothetical protein|nr:hypothetical protein [Allosphingosinicella sp.]
MSWYYLEKEGERPKLALAPGRAVTDERTDAERVLDAYPGYAVVCTLERAPEQFEFIDPATGAIELDMAAIDAELLASIDAAAGAFRGRFLTTIIGQQSAYRRKETEARALVAGGAGPWPMIEAEAAATGVEAAELAAVIIAGADTWADLEPKIEAARLGAKKAVTAATTEAEKRAEAAIQWDALADPTKPVQPLGGKGSA